MVSTRRMLVALALVALAAAGCGGDDEGGDETGSEGSNGEAATLTASGLKFDTDSLTVASGGSIELVNEDDTEHNLTAEEAELDEDVDPGDTATIDLGGVEPGTYDFFCEYHPETMTGTLEVTE
ncbi:MAG: cupredoxin domain-containing protein [Actinomycetota bacterium]